MGRKKYIFVPKQDEHLAEFFGIFLGDGGLKNNFQIAISFNSKTEKPYAKYVADLILTLFGLESSIRERPIYGSADLIINSCELVDFLQASGVIEGNETKKKSKLPEWVFETDLTRQGALRGLFDTDGCVYEHCYNRNGIIYQYPKLAFTAYGSILRRQFFELLVLLDFHPRDYRNRVYLYSQGEVLRYMEVVGTQNPWHRVRFETFCEDLKLEKLFCY